MKMKSRHCKTVKLFAGIDLHKESFNVHVIDENERKVDNRKLTTAEESIRNYFSMYVGQSMEVAVEVGNPTFWFCDILESMGFSYRIVNPLEYSRTSNNKKKNDDRDARNLAFDLKRNNLPEIDVCKTDPVQRELRTLIIHRHQYIKGRVQTVNRTYSFLSSRGIKIKKSSLKDTYIGWERLFAKINKESHPEFVSTELRRYHEDFKHFMTHIKDIEDHMRQIVKANYLAIYNRLITVPGIGVITALCMIALVGDWSRFASGKKLSSYFGLVPSHRESGGRKLKGDGRITKEGSPLMRSYLIQGAASLSRYKTKDSEPLIQWYEDKKTKRGWKKARVAVARKICEIVFAMIRNGTDYDPKLLTKNSQPAV